MSPFASLRQEVCFNSSAALQRFLTGHGKIIPAKQSFGNLYVWDKSRTLTQDAQKVCPAIRET